MLQLELVQRGHGLDRDQVLAREHRGWGLRASHQLARDAVGVAWLVQVLKDEVALFRYPPAGQRRAIPTEALARREHLLAVPEVGDPAMPAREQVLARVFGSG